MPFPNMPPLYPGYHHILFPIPWLPTVPLPLSHRIANLLLSDEVQQISFRFGHVITLPEGFRKVADAIRDGRVSVSADATGVPSGATAAYNQFTNVLHFGAPSILDSADGRGTTVHECRHAVSDVIARKTAMRHEEAACFIAESWYLQNIGAPRNAGITQSLWDIATALRGRAARGRPVTATGAEINAGRRAVAVEYAYENEHYSFDGV